MYIKTPFIRLLIKRLGEIEGIEGSKQSRPEVMQTRPTCTWSRWQQYKHEVLLLAPREADFGWILQTSLGHCRRDEHWNNSNTKDKTLRNVLLNGLASKEIYKDCLKKKGSELTSKQVMEIAADVEARNLMAEDLSDIAKQTLYTG